MNKQTGPFFLIVIDEDRGAFLSKAPCPMTDPGSPRSVRHANKGSVALSTAQPERIASNWPLSSISSAS